MNTNRWSARPLTEGALLAALTVVLALLSQVLPLVGVFVPVPIVYISLRHGLRTSFLSTVVAGLALMFTLGPGTALLTTVAFGSVGLSIGLGVRRKWPVTWTLALAAAAGLISTGLEFALAVYVGIGINPFLAMPQAMAQMQAAMHKAIEQSPTMPPEAKAQAKLAMDQGTALLSRSLWAIVVVGAVGAAALQYALIRWTLRRMRVDIPAIPPFTTWKMPGDAVVLLVGAMALTFLGDRVGYPLLGTVGQGVLVMLAYAYGTTGVAFGYELLRRFGISKVSAVILLAVLLFSLGPLVVVAGFLDSVMDMRQSFGPQPD